METRRGARSKDWKSLVIMILLGMVTGGGGASALLPGRGEHSEELAAQVQQLSEQVRTLTAAVDRINRRFEVDDYMRTHPAASTVGPIRGAN